MPPNTITYGPDVMCCCGLVGYSFRVLASFCRLLYSYDQGGNRDSTPTLFFDRNPDVFPIVLDYLRTGKVSVAAVRAACSMVLCPAAPQKDVDGGSGRMLRHRPNTIG